MLEGAFPLYASQSRVGEEDIDNSIFCILSLVTCSNIVRMF